MGAQSMDQALFLCMFIAKKQQNAKRLTSGRVRVGTIKKAVATAGNISIKNKLGRPLKKRIEPHPSKAISARKKQYPKKKPATFQLHKQSPTRSLQPPPPLAWAGLDYSAKKLLPQFITVQLFACLFIACFHNLAPTLLISTARGLRQWLFKFWRFAIALPFFMPRQKIAATKKLRGKESKCRAKKFTAQNFRECKKIEGGTKKEGGYISTPSFFEQVENLFESIK